MFLDIETLLGPTNFVPVDRDILLVGMIKTHWKTFSYLALEFGSNPAVLATRGVEEYVLGVHCVVKIFCVQSSNTVPTVRCGNLSRARTFKNVMTLVRCRRA